MMTSKIVKCTCNHPMQDSLYGSGNRCANETRSGQYRCTSCGALIGSAQVMSTTVSQKVAAKKAEPVKTTKEPEKKKSLKGGKR